MKRCPQCHQTFEEEWLSFCTDDGTTLIDDGLSSSEPPPTVMAPTPSDQAGWNVPSAELPPSSPEWRPPERVAQEWRPPPPPLHVQPPNKSLATASMVLGLISVTVGWLCFGPIPGIAAIILGAVALSQIKKNPDRVTGTSMAWTGIITGGVTVLIYLGFMIFYVIIAIAANA
jgi:hypothetical protein